MISFRPTPKDEHALETIQEYLTMHYPPGVKINRSDAIRYAIQMAEIDIRKEWHKENKMDRTNEVNDLQQIASDIVSYSEEITRDNAHEYVDWWISDGDGNDPIILDEHDRQLLIEMVVSKL